MRAPTLLLVLLLASAATGKGRAWSYLMEGYVYDHVTKEVMRNTAIMIGEHLVTTDSTGHYQVTISGVTCDRGNSRAEVDRCNEEAFGQLVVRRLFSEAAVSIRTNWKAHACLDRMIFTPPRFISRCDLFVP